MICSSEPLGMMRASTTSQSNRSGSAAPSLGASLAGAPRRATSDSYGRRTGWCPRSRMARCSSSVCQPLRALRTAIFMVREKRGAAIRRSDVWPRFALAGLRSDEHDLPAAGEVLQISRDCLESLRGGAGLQRRFGWEPELRLAIMRRLRAVEIARELDEHRLRESDLLRLGGDQRQVGGGVVLLEC